MTNLTRLLWILLGLFGCSAVALGAYGAHVASFDEIDRARFDTALLYHLIHLAGLAAALLIAARAPSRLALTSACFFVAGTLLFSGALYFSAFSGGETSTAAAPYGGTAFMAGWLALGLAGMLSVKTES